MVLRSDEVASCFQPRGTRLGGAAAFAADANDNTAANIAEHAVSFEVDVRAKVMSRQRMGRSVVPTWGAPELRRYAAMLAIGMPRSRRHRWKFFQFSAARAMPSLYMRLAEWKPNRPNARSGWRTSGCLSNLAIPHHRRKGEHRGAEALVLLAQNCPVTAGPRKLRDKNFLISTLTVFTSYLAPRQGRRTGDGPSGVEFYRALVSKSPPGAKRIGTGVARARRLHGRGVLVLSVYTVPARNQLLSTELT